MKKASVTKSAKKKKAIEKVFIEIAEDKVRLLLAHETPEGISIADIKSMQFGPADEIEAARFVHACYKNWKLKDRQATLVVSSKLTITKNVDIPSKDKEEIKKIIDLQAGRYTPYSRDEIVIDFLCMEAKDQPYTNVLLMIVQRKIVERYYAILNRALVEGVHIVSVSEALSTTYEKLVDSTMEGAVAGLCVSSDSSDITITDRRQMIFIRSVPIGSQNFSADAEGVKKDFTGELQKSITSYQDQGVGRPVKHLLIACLSQELSFLENEIQTCLSGISGGGIKLTKVDPRSLFSLEDQAVKALEGEQISSWFDLFACAASFPDLKIDLVPKEVKLKHKFREGGRDIITLGTLVMTVFLMFSVFLVSKIFLRKEQIKKLDQIEQSTSEESKTLEQTSTKTRILKELIKNRGRGLYVFEKINSMIGDDIYLTSLSYDKEGKVIFSGTAESMSRVFAFVTELEESNYFKDVTTNSTKSRREGQKEVADFEIACVSADAQSVASETGEAPVAVEPK